LLRDMVCLRNICINTLHKGDSDDDDDSNNNNNNNNNIISACPKSAKEQYIDMIECVLNNTSICKELKIKSDNEHRYDHVPQSVETSHEGTVTTLWNQQILRTNRTIPNNKQDSTIRDNKQGACMLTDVALPGDRNVTNKEAEKILNYKDLITEIQRIWNVKAKVMPVIIGTTGTISKSPIQYLSNIPGKQDITELQQPQWELQTYCGK
jgi:hypothetical protein